MSTTALSNKLLPIGDGRHRTLSEAERVLLAHLLAGPDRFRVTLAELARELFGSSRPGDVASPLWRLRSAGLAAVEVVPGDGDVVVDVVVLHRQVGEALLAANPSSFETQGGAKVPTKMSNPERMAAAQERIRRANGPWFELVWPVLPDTIGRRPMPTSQAEANGLLEVLALHAEVTAAVRRQCSALVAAAGLSGLPPCELEVEDLGPNADGNYEHEWPGGPPTIRVDFAMACRTPAAVRGPSSTR